MENGKFAGNVKEMLEAFQLTVMATKELRIVAESFLIAT